MFEFTYKALPWNIIFAPGALSRLPAELEKMGLHRAMILTTPGRKAEGERLLELLYTRAAGLFDQARMHVPKAALAAARAMATDLNADCTIAIGGGSTTGLGKALAVEAGLPNIVIPTTFSGSEMTDIWAVTEDGNKVTARDGRAVPTLTLYDPELIVSLPVNMAVVSGLNALAQAIVNVAVEKPNPIVAGYALEGIRALVTSLPGIKDQPEGLAPRAQALYGASMAGAALGTGTTGLHHRLCHILGGTFNTPHAETHAILLPHTVAYNAGAAAEGTARVAEAMGVKDAASGLYDLAGVLGAPRALRDIGVQESDLDEVARLTTEKAINNPAPVTAESVRELLQTAYSGISPREI